MLAVGLFVTLLDVSPAAAEVELEVAPATWLVAGTPAVFEVTVTADQATTGTIVVRFEEREFHRERVEVPGGATKRFTVISSAPPWTSTAEVRFEADSGGTKVARLSVEDKTADRVVVFPSLASPGLPETIALAAGGGRAETATFDPALLDAGHHVLGPATAALATVADLEALSPDQTRSLATWVATGADLIVEGTTGDLPPDLVGPGGAASGSTVWVGQGQIRLVDEVLSGGRLDGIVVPNRGFDEFGGNMVVDVGQIAGPLADDSGISVMNITPIVLALLVYIVIVGPVLWVGLRSVNRQPAFWLLAPGLAMAMTAGIWLVGQVAQRSANASFAALVVDNGPVRTTAIDALLYSRNGGTVGLRLDDGWRTAPRVIDPWSQFGEQSLSVGELSGDELDVDVPPGGVTVLSAERSEAATDRAWTVEIDSLDDDSLSGRITNQTPYRLSGVVVGLGQRATAVEAVDPGQSVEFELDVSIPELDINEDPNADRVAARLRVLERSEPASAGVYSRWRAEVDLASTTLVAVGWTDEAPLELSAVDGGTIDRGRTGFLTTTALQDASGGASEAVAELLPGRGRKVSTVWDGDGGEGLLLDRPGVAELVVGPASAGNPGRSGPRADGSPSPSDGDDDNADGDSEDGESVVGIDEARDEAVLAEGFPVEGERFAIVYTYQLHAGGQAEAQLALDLTGITGLDYWDGSDWSPSGIANLDGEPSVWAIPEAAVGEGIVMVRVWDDYDQVSPELRRPDPSEELVWTVGA